MDILIIVGVIAFLFLMAFMGYKRGFVKIILSMFALLAAIIISSILVVPVGAVVKKSTPIYDQIQKNVESAITEKGVEKISDLDKINIPDNIKAAIKEETADISANIAGKLSELTANSIFNAGVFVVTFIVVYILVIIIINAINLVTKLPILNEVNKLAGTLIGLVYGLGILWVVCLIIPMCANMDWAKTVIKVINENDLLKFIYNHNLLVDLITHISK